jgi:DNA-binding MarR family transcriptional regulator
VADDSARRLLSALRRLTGAFTAMGYRFGELHGLSRSDVAALIVITEASEQGTSIGTVELARRIGITAPSATVLVDRLIDAGLLARQRDLSDGRRVVLTLTAAARAAGRDHFGTLNDMLLQMLDAHSPDDLRTAAAVVDQAADLAIAKANEAGDSTTTDRSRPSSHRGPDAGDGSST